MARLTSSTLAAPTRPTRRRSGGRAGRPRGTTKPIPQTYRPCTPMRMTWTPSASRGKAGQLCVFRTPHDIAAQTPVCYTAGDVARKSGLSFSAVARILTGERRGTVETLGRIAEAMGVTLDALHRHLHRVRHTWLTRRTPAAASA